MERKQFGGSIIGLLITLAVVGYGAYVGIQYVPQYIEYNTVGAILENLEEQHRKERFTDVRSVQAAIDKQLYINERSDLKDSFSVVMSRGNYIVTVRYERELNLLYTRKTMPYEETVTLARPD